MAASAVAANSACRRTRRASGEGGPAGQPASRCFCAAAPTAGRASAATDGRRRPCPRGGPFRAAGIRQAARPPRRRRSGRARPGPRPALSRRAPPCRSSLEPTGSLPRISASPSATRIRGLMNTRSSSRASERSMTITRSWTSTWVAASPMTGARVHGFRHVPDQLPISGVNQSPGRQPCAAAGRDTRESATAPWCQTS